MALYPFGQGFSAVLASWLLPALGASEANAPPTVATLSHPCSSTIMASQGWLLLSPPNNLGQLLQMKQSRWARRGAGPAQALWPLGLDCLYPVPSFVISQLYAGKGCYLEANVPQCPLGSHHIWKEAGFVPGHETLFGAGGQAAENIHF